MGFQIKPLLMTVLIHYIVSNVTSISFDKLIDALRVTENYEMGEQAIP